MNRQRCLILIDDSNFYFKLKDLKVKDLLNFDFTSFAKFVSRSQKVTSIKYYVGKIKQDNTKKSQELFTGQQKLLAQLKKHKVQYVFGYLLRTKGIYHEKGVDVQIAVDMLDHPYLIRY